MKKKPKGCDHHPRTPPPASYDHDHRFNGFFLKPSLIVKVIVILAIVTVVIVILAIVTVVLVIVVIVTVVILTVIK